MPAAYTARAEGPLFEQVETYGARVDRDACVIRGVKIIGTNSQRGRTYTDRALAEAVPLYESAEINVEHPRDERDQLKIRPLVEGWGRLENVKHVPGVGLFGDLHYLQNHPYTPLFLERIEKGYPIGLSHNARGKWRTEGNRTIVESIPVVISVDLVRRGAATKSLFESENMETQIHNRPTPRIPRTIAGIRNMLRSRGGSLLEDVAGDQFDDSPPSPDVDFAMVPVSEIRVILESTTLYDNDKCVAIGKALDRAVAKFAQDKASGRVVEAPALESIASIRTLLRSR